MSGRAGRRGWAGAADGTGRGGHGPGDASARVGPGREAGAVSPGATEGEGFISGCAALALRRKAEARCDMQGVRQAHL